MEESEVDNVKIPPVDPGDEVELTIEAKGGKGDGIGRIDGYVIFVPDTEKGDVVKVKIVKVFRSMGIGEKQ